MEFNISSHEKISKQSLGRVIGAYVLFDSCAVVLISLLTIIEWLLFDIFDFPNYVGNIICVFVPTTLLIVLAIGVYLCQEDPAHDVSRNV